MSVTNFIYLHCKLTSSIGQIAKLRFFLYDNHLTFVIKLEEGQVKMQSRLEEEEEAKAALMSRIQRLTKLILVSSKNSIPGLSEISGHQGSLSVGEDDVSYPVYYCDVHFITFWICMLRLEYRSFMVMCKMPNQNCSLKLKFEKLIFSLFGIVK